MSAMVTEHPAAGTVPAYVYAIVPGDRFRGALTDLGLEAAPVRALPCGRVAALVSRGTQARVRPSRSNLMTHQRVVDAAHQASPVLPVRFGTVLPGEDAVRSELLQPNAERFTALLDRMEGKDEYRLRASYVEEAVLREVVQSNPSIQRARDSLRRRSGLGHRDGMIVLGEMVRSALEQARTVEAKAILESLAPHVVEYERLAERADTVALHAALLVARGERERLEEAVETMAHSQAGRMQMELIGPLPPWDFTEISAGAP